MHINSTSMCQWLLVAWCPRTHIRSSQRSVMSDWRVLTEVSEQEFNNSWINNSSHTVCVMFSLLKVYYKYCFKNFFHSFPVATSWTTHLFIINGPHSNSENEQHWESVSWEMSFTVRQCCECPRNSSLLASSLLNSGAHYTLSCFTSSATCQKLKFCRKNQGWKESLAWLSFTH